MVGAVAATLMARAWAEPGAVRLEIAIFCGPAQKRWNPESLPKAGDVGVQADVASLGRALAARGHRVRVFAECEGMEGTFDDVEWLDYRRFGDFSCDILLSCLQPSAVDRIHDVRAKVSILWLATNDDHEL